MTKKELRKKLLDEKKVDLMNLQLSEEYLKERINKYKEIARRNLLSKVEEGIKETKKLVKFFNDENKKA